MANAIETLTDAEFGALLEQAREIGADHGRNAAGWWEQDAIGGRASGDVRAVARAILSGLDDGDPAVWDSLPGPDLSGQWADGYTCRDLAEDLDVIEDEYVTGECADAYCDGFSEAVVDAVASACRSVLD